MPSIRQPQSLETIRIISEFQTYVPAVSFESLTGTRLTPQSLGNDYIDVLLSRRNLSGLPEANQDNLVLEEGLLDCRQQGIGFIVVSLQYNYRKRRTEIEVPGMYIDPDSRDISRVSVRLLDGVQKSTLRDIVELHSDVNKYVIWPADKFRPWKPGRIKI